MSLSAKYATVLRTQFNSSHYAPSAALHYIPTTTTVSGAAISRHLTDTARVLELKNEIVSSVEDLKNNRLVAEVKADITFLSTGGPYLPGLDEAFVAGHKATLLTVHVVEFDAAEKISQIRFYWDQGSLLKMVGVIGARSHAWPIRRGGEQLAVLNKAVESQSETVSEDNTDMQDTPVAQRTRTTTHDSNEYESRSRTHSHHSSLREPVTDSGRLDSYDSIAPRATARPPSRDLFAESPEGRSERSNSTAGKGGAKPLGPSRLFGVDEDEREHEPTRERFVSPEKIKKYEHFEFSHGERDAPVPDMRPAPKAGDQAKHRSQWDFSDFATPSKPKATAKLSKAEELLEAAEQERRQAQENARLNAQKVKSEEEKTQSQAEKEVSDAPAPTRTSTAPVRPDRTAQFEIRDDSDPNARFDNERASQSTAEQSSTTTDPKARHENLDPHFEIGVPGSTSTSQDGTLAGAAKTSNRRAQAQTLAPQFSISDNNAPLRPTDANAQFSIEQRMERIAIGGDGMGGRKGSARTWMSDTGGEDFDGSETGKQDRKLNEGKIKTLGNGMGGRSGEAQWWEVGQGQNEGPRGKENEKPASKARSGLSRSEAWDF